MSQELAQRYKIRRAALLAKVAEGQLPVREVLTDGRSKVLRRCAVHKILEAAPGMGPQKTRKTLEQAKVWPLLGLGELSEFQRQSIMSNLPDWVK